jgi:S-adenosylmethionine synthetase
VETFGTGKVPEEKIARAVRDVFDLRPSGIVSTLDLRKPIYQETAAYGHFGRGSFRWEQTDRVEEIKRALE